MLLGFNILRVPKIQLSFSNQFKHRDVLGDVSCDFCFSKVLHELCYCFKRNLLFEIHSKPDKVDCLVVNIRVVSVIAVVITIVNVCATVAVVAVAVVVSDIDTDIIVAVATVFVVNIVAVAIPADTTGIVVATVVVNTVVAIFVKD